MMSAECDATATSGSGERSEQVANGRAEGANQRRSIRGRANITKAMMDTAMTTRSVSATVVMVKHTPENGDGCSTQLMNSPSPRKENARHKAQPFGIQLHFEHLNPGDAIIVLLSILRCTCRPRRMPHLGHGGLNIAGISLLLSRQRILSARCLKRHHACCLRTLNLFFSVWMWRTSAVVIRALCRYRRTVHPIKKPTRPTTLLRRSIASVYSLTSLPPRRAALYLVIRTSTVQYTEPQR
jgi:hypothetical protein